MGEDTRQIADIEHTIRQERKELGRNLDELESQARALADWRTHYRRHTGVALAAAFGGGVIIGAASGRRRSHAPVYRAPEVRPSASSDQRPMGFRALQALDNPRARHQLGEAWEGILEGLIGVGSAKLVQWISSVVPGFEDEYSRRGAPAGSDRRMPRTGG